ncbi:MAG: SPOR domain-containing protein [Deltaproteobacteria bacterium]|nr:SPOR domain-containing protein [Deltaproteobacteria bacterium]
MSSREPELYKDKVEVSLDGRQIFYLFFGGAMIVGIVFVLGVLVGRRVEARGHIDRARTMSGTDPLAALDRLESTSGGLAFRGTLTGKDAPTSVEKTIDQLEKARTKTDVKKPEKVEAKPEKVEAKPEKVEAKPEKIEAKPEKVEAKPEKIEAKKPATEVEPKSVTKPDAKPVTRPDAVEAKAEAKPDAKPEEPKQRFTLQLSSFQDRSEAEAFLDTVKAKGYQAQITQAEVEGKGTFYRVRMGNYRSLDAATSAKSDFEKASSKSASIMKL